MAESISYKDTSRKIWSSSQPETEDLREKVSIGALQRIADATEAMAKNHIQMQRDLDWYKSMYKSASASIASRDRSISNLRGQITKLKKQLASK